MSSATLLSLCQTDVATPIDPETTKATLLRSPFIYVPGTFNTRDIGLVPTATDTATPLRKGFAYRSGALQAITPEAKTLLTDKLGVRKIFDLRSLAERTKGPDPEIDGVANVWKLTAEREATVDIADFIDGDGERGYEKMYLDVLDVYQPLFRAVLEHVRDKPEEPFLYHCTAGRDRTGVMSGMLLTLAGVDQDTVKLDFLLSRVGTEPARELLLSFAKKGAGVESHDAPGFKNLCSLRASCWEAFLAGVERQYGGFRGYVTGTLGFSEDEVESIVSNLTAAP